MNNLKTDIMKTKLLNLLTRKILQGEASDCPLCKEAIKEIIESIESGKTTVIQLNPDEHLLGNGEKIVLGFHIEILKK